MKVKMETAFDEMVEKVMEPVGRMDGDSLPVSAFAGEHVDGELLRQCYCPDL